MALRALLVDLQRGEARHQLPAAVERDYLGGRGAIAWLLWNFLPRETAPLAPENLLVFAAGPLAGTDSFATGGFVVGARSPLTGGIGYGWAEGMWGSALRRAGHDVLMLRGQSPDWCFLQLDGKQTRIHAATHLRSFDTQRTVEAIRSQLGPNYSVVCVGPAGEANVAYASIVADGRHIAEPAGAGVVMAHKRVKAIAVRNDLPTLAVRDARKLAVAMEIIRRRVTNSPIVAQLLRSGSTAYFAQALEWGALTERNGQHGRLGDKMQQLPAALAQRYRRDTASLSDDKLLRFSAGLPRPTLEEVAGFGMRCGITSPEAIGAISDLCLRLGLDPVSASASVAFLMECQETGLNQAGTLPWGNDDAVITALERLGHPQEKRDVLSLGVGEMQEIFWGSAAFAPQVKGLAMPGLDPRALTGMALTMATAPIGGDYRYAMNYEELLEEPPPWLPDEPSHPQAVKGKVLRVIWHERFAAVLDSAGISRQLGLMAYQVSPGELIALISAATGRSFNGTELARLGERIVTVERLFARHECDNGALDELPLRWNETPLEEGRAAGHLVALDELLPEYYRRHGWSRVGDPVPSRLAELGIADTPHRT